MMDAGWDSRLLSLKDPHFLQTKEWAAIKARIGWTAEQKEWRDERGKLIAAAQLLVRSMRPFRIGPRISIGYIPRGPLLDWRDKGLRTRVICDIETWAKEKNLVFVKIDPEVELGRGILGSPGESPDEEGAHVCEELRSRGWNESREQIQFRNTVILNLQGTEEEWLARMKQKTRYNLRLAQKNGVTVRPAVLDELPLLYQMYAETAQRDGFIIRPAEYYLEVWQKYIQAGMAEALVAEVEGRVVAGLVYFFLGTRAWYVYGMSTGRHREKMPNYLLQWEAMRGAKARGCLVYDLWGAPEVFSNEDAMYGVYRFKEGLGGIVVRTIGAWDFPVNRTAYFIFQQVIPRMLSITRFIRRRQIQQEVQ
ncbi:MAG: peptidoglycan bridge formation glycyltransferase FemA/FemB family protein [Anaerolineaceae bacterium]|nr:peptidoglycan bridge formation glycyltransferase FemA/FemB family protein [Anaerolineaceae bacterium]